MGQSSAGTSARPFTLTLTTWLVSQNVAENYSTLGWSLVLSGTNPSYSFNPSYYSVDFDGAHYEGSFTYDFRNYSSITLRTGQQNVGHMADGSRNYGIAGAVNAALIGTANTSFTEWLPAIPRATKAVVSPASGPTGTVYSIGTTAASGSFFHDLYYSLDNGANYVQIAADLPSGSPANYGWTPPHTLFPNSAGGNVVILVRTKSATGGAATAVIGDSTAVISLTVPATVKPTITNVTWGDVQTSGPDIPTLMGGGGRYVQGWSRLLPTISAQGASGSSVVGTSATMNGQVTGSGTAFAAPVALSGAVPFTALAQDSRGRYSETYANTVPVVAYAPPILNTPTVTRTSDAAGNVPSPTGTYLSITPSASVSPLGFGGVQKNLLEWQIRIKPAGGAYTTVAAWSATSVSGNTWTSKYIAAGPYAPSVEWVVEVSVRDIFSKGGYSSATGLAVTVPSEKVAFDWDGADGIGIGKYRTNGMLDVGGEVYAENKKLGGYWQTTDSVSPTATPDAFAPGTTTMFVSPSPLWPINDYGNLVTVRPYVSAPGGTIQYWSGYQNSNHQVFHRQWFYQASAWGPWISDTEPAGQITMYSGYDEPVGYLLCNGQAVSRTKYSRLFTAIATNYGAGDGAGTFNVPNFNGRVPVGTDANQQEFAWNGIQGGEKKHYLGSAETPNKHSVEEAAGYGLVPSSAFTDRVQVNRNGAYGLPFNVLQPYIGIAFIIKV
jgi:microcystin-dependent protein